MKLSKGVLIVDNNGEEYLITVGEAAKKFHGMVRLNKTAAFIVHAMENPICEEELLNRMTEKYDVTPETALKSIRSLTKQLMDVGLAEE